MKTTDLQPVTSYLTDEERKALDMLARIESRSTSSLVKTLIVKELKDRGLFKEELIEGEIVQTVIASGEGAVL